MDLIRILLFIFEKEEQNKKRDLITVLSLNEFEQDVSLDTLSSLVHNGFLLSYKALKVKGGSEEVFYLSQKGREYCKHHIVLNEICEKNQNKVFV